MSATYQVLLLNMNRSTERLARCSALLKKHNIEFVRIDAIDGSTLSPQQINRVYDPHLNTRQYHKSLTNGEIGCYLSHLKAWQYIVDNQLEFAIILEDDFMVQGNLDGLPEAIQSIPGKWHCLKLAEFPIKRKSREQAKINDFSLISYHKVPARTCAQAISLEGAERLLTARKRFGRPVDIDLQYWWEAQINVYGLKPYLFSPTTQVSSEIDSIVDRKKTNSRLVAKLSQALCFRLKNQPYGRSV